MAAQECPEAPVQECMAGEDGHMWQEGRGQGPTMGPEAHEGQLQQVAPVWGMRQVGGEAGPTRLSTIPSQVEGLVYSGGLQ